MYNITDFGAEDGSLCTAAIQNAIDKCAENGGGEVVVPKGTYISSTIWLRDNIELHLEKGAVLKASSDMSDYNADDAYPQNWGCPSENWRGKHFIIAHEVENIAITGLGTIHGSCEEFFSDRIVGSSGIGYDWEGGYYALKDDEKQRPGQLVCFIECRDVRVTDVTFRNSPCWTCYFHGCEYIRVHGVKIFNPLEGINTDGLDFDCCRFAEVSDCMIETGDDAITFRCDSKRLKNPKPCEYITVTNCTLTSKACTFRIGVGTGEIRHIRVSTLTVPRTGTLINFAASYAGRGEAHIRDVEFENISAARANKALTLSAAIGEIKRVSVKNANITARGGISVIQRESGEISGVLLQNLDMTMEDNMLNEKALIDIVGASQTALEHISVTVTDGGRWESTLSTSGSKDTMINDLMIR